MLPAKELIAFIPTLDSARSRSFYEEVLGMKLVKDDGHALTFLSNGGKVRVSKVPPEFKPAGFTILGWAVDDIRKSVEAWKRAGVNFERFGFFEQDDLGVWTAPTGDKVAWFKDPDGNILSLSQHVD